MGIFSEAKNSTDFVLPPTCTSTRRGEAFVLYDGFTDRNVRIIIFSTQRNVEILTCYPNWICDGTFYVCPKIFAQSYSIHSVDNKCVPLMYILKGDTYSHMLEVIKYFAEEKLGITIQHGSVLIDFEKAAMNAFKDVLPDWIVRNCFFHLCQSCQKKIQEKFKVYYYSDVYFARASRLVVFLAFVPIADIDEAFYEVTYYYYEVTYYCVDLSAAYVCFELL